MSSVSQILRQTRENRGILLDEVARRTYIKLPYLEALEQGSVESLPAPVFVHGYIRQYAKLLGLDATELVQRYQQEVRQEPLPLVLAPVRSMADNSSDGDVEPYSFNGNGHGDRHADEYGNGNGTDLHLADLYSRLDSARERLGSRPLQALERTLPMTHDLHGNNGSTDPAIADARVEAQRIIAEAQREAQALRKDAERYAHQVLSELEAEISRSLSIIRNGRQFLSQRRRPLPTGAASLPDIRRG